MEELRQILLSHAARYPKMEPRDAVKLIYQNEFGGGHLIRDEESCLSYLCREYGVTSQSSVTPLTEDIGNGSICPLWMPMVTPRNNWAGTLSGLLPSIPVPGIGSCKSWNC